MGLFDFIRKRREEEKIFKAELEDYKRKLITEMRLRGEIPRLKRSPEEIELEQYLEENRRDRIRKLLAKERKKRSIFGYANLDPIKTSKFKLGFNKIK